MSNGKGSSPRSCFSRAFRENYDQIFGRPDQDITDEINRILDEEPESSDRTAWLYSLSMTKAGRILRRRRSS